MMYRSLSASALLIVGSLSAQAQPQESGQQRPNFVVIVADDMGYSDLGCYGGEIDTPNIDALAEAGVRFRQFYNCSRCCQTRASLLTGYYAQRVGMEDFGRTMDLHVPTIAERLRAAGYRTAMTGKWHLSALPEEPQGEQRLRWMNHQLKLNVPFAEPASLPTRRGFEKFYGMIWGVFNHFDPFSLCEGDSPVQQVPAGYYVTDAISERSAEYVRELAGDEAPFLLYVAYSAPHWPLQAPVETIDKYRGKYDGGWDQLRDDRFRRQVELGLFPEHTPVDRPINGGPEWNRLAPEVRSYYAQKMAVHAAMVDRLDAGVGRIVDALRECGELDNTLILVMSDNGASPEIPGGPGYDRYSATRQGAAALRESELLLPENRGKLGSEESYTGIGSAWASAVNTPLRYWKMESYEGGCRTPLVVHWPAGLKSPAGAFRDAMGHVADISPTMLDLADVDGWEGLKLDGKSLRTAIVEGGEVPDRTLYFTHDASRGVREAQWKASKRARQGWELFDLSVDPGETHDLSGAHPEKLNELVRKVYKWRQAVEARVRPDTKATIAAPAVPLVACDPYFSIWSPSDRLSDADTMHWTGKPHRLASLVTIDGQPFRLMGQSPQEAPALPQTGLTITPTQTKYSFGDQRVKLKLNFTTPALPYDLDQLSRPVTYLSYACESADGQPHDVRVYFEASAEIAVDQPQQRVRGRVARRHGLIDLTVGSVEQNILGRSGDDLRIDWGYLHVACADDKATTGAVGRAADLRRQFLTGEPLRASSTPQPRQAGRTASAVAFDFPQVKAESAHGWLVLAYDDLYSIEFMQTRLRPYWRRNGLTAAGLLAEAARDRDKLLAQCERFDEELRKDMVSLGGNEYAAIASLAYRQCFAAGKVVADANGQPIQFCKENHSNGCIGTADVFYPMSPQFLLFGSTLAKSFVVPFMEYAASDRWKFPFAPHDLGTYPKANGQVYGGGERSDRNQMPVEESGNLLILMAAIAKLDGDAEFAARYWPQLEQWAEYLEEKGFDPANQLCTDDFAGHMAHNVNLSAKAICGLGAFAQLCELRGEKAEALKFRQAAEEFAARWQKEADDGDHYRLAFDKPATWSQKYNLVWDKVLGLNLFRDDVYRKEMEYYRRIQNQFGLPLDNRRDYTKLDWILWTATLTQQKEDFEALVHPVFEFLRGTPDRVPTTDWYETTSARRVGFTARPVVGGVFMQFLHNGELWRKWSERSGATSGVYAAMPTPPRFKVLVAAANTEPAEWHYTTQDPGPDWFSVPYDDSQWRTGKSGFGTTGTPGARLNTTWGTPDIWLRRTFNMEGDANHRLRLMVHHDEDAEIYVNGVLAAKTSRYTTDYYPLTLRREAINALKPKDNVLAVHCRQTEGGQYIDVGLSMLEYVERQ